LATVGAAARRFAGRVQVVGVHRGKFPTEREDASVAAAVDRLGVGYPVVNDADGAVWDAFAVRAWPTLLLIDGRGRLVARHEGEIAEAALLAALAPYAWRARRRSGAGMVTSLPANAQTPLPGRRSGDP
jgi:hypothetical protein